MSAPAPSADETSARIERLLADLRAQVSPLAWQRVDELLATVVEVYGRALGRLYGAVAPAEQRGLADDELIGSLLALHGLHPLTIDERIRQALAQLAPQLGRLELSAIDRGVAQVRAVDAPAVRGARKLIERALEEAAPELAGVHIEGLREPAPSSGLVQIDLARSRAAGGE